LLKAGAYTDHKVSISLISHPGITRDAALLRTSAYQNFRVEYFGKEAHAAAAPWEGINALDALISAYTSISLLRQQTQPGDIIQGNITHGGTKPNIIHAHAAGNFVVRSTTLARLTALKHRVDACFAAAATATGTTLRITPQGAYADHAPNRTLGASYRTHFNALGGAIPHPDLDILTAATMASTDQGDVSHALPSLSPGFWIRSEGEDGAQMGGPHTRDFARAAATEEAFRLALRVGKALAGTAVDVLTKQGLLEAVREEFEEMKRVEGWGVAAAGKL
jgi:metal-dependent amidase/aminoacylase/carboxypeptidase family protein